MKPIDTNYSLQIQITTKGFLLLRNFTIHYWIHLELSTFARNAKTRNSRKRQRLLFKNRSENQFACSVHFKIKLQSNLCQCLRIQ